jgi:hypothetical protein
MTSRPFRRCTGRIGFPLATAIAVGVLAAAPANSGGQSPPGRSGQAAGILHPVMHYGIDPAKAAAYEGAVRQVMAMTDAEMLAFVPDRPFCRFCDCPHCHGGSQGIGVFGWSIDRPDELKCQYCGMVFPNTKYPDDQLLEGKNALGETFAYRYHQDNARPDLRIFIAGQILMHKSDWIVRQCEALGRAWQATHKAEYARRAALILDRIAQVYPHYPVMEQRITTFAFADSQKPPYPIMGGKWGRWMYSELPAGVIEAYDLVYDSDEFDRLSKARGYDVREKIERDLFKAAWEYVNTFADHSSNMAPSCLRTAIRIGRVINEPHYVHWAYRWLLETLHHRCFYDGAWCESPSYHYQVMGDMAAAFDDLTGHTDPPGFADPDDGKRFDRLDPHREAAFFARAKDAFACIAWPNGISSPVHDSWADKRWFAVRTQTASSILPGFGHASLGSGRGENQMQAQLHFSGGYGHHHADNLNLSLFAKGREMLCDIGYTHTKLRSWTIATAGHNLVVVDRRQQRTQDSDGDLLAFFPNVAGVSAVEADGKRAYADVPGLDTYRRLLVTVPADGGDVYVVDIFRVRGGALHDWMLHGSGDHNMTAACSVPLAAGRETMLEPGEKWVEPLTEGSWFNPYGVIRDVSHGKTNGNARVIFRYANEPGCGLGVHLLGPGETELYLGRSPRVRTAGADSNKVYDFWMPQLIARRRGAAPLATTFVAVEEPFSGRPFLDQIEAMRLTPAAEGCAALRVVHGDVSDTIISTLDGPPYPERVVDGDIRIKGRLGIVRRRGNQTTDLWLFDGQELAAGASRLQSDAGRYSGVIETAMRKADGAEQDGFVTRAELPPGQLLHGQWLIVTHGNGFTHGYEIDRVEKQGDKRLIVLSFDHGLKIEGNRTQEVYFPRRKIDGVNTFVVPLSASTAAGNGNP